MNSPYEQKILNLFENFYYLPNTDSLVLVGRLPDLIVEEIDRFTSVCSVIKDNPLFFLKHHENGPNAYHLSVPINIFEDSFTFAFLLRMGTYYLHKSTGKSMDELARSVRMRRNYGHFDGYDFWVNFMGYGSYNDWHGHSGSLSGVIYVDNEISLPTNFKNDASFCGKKGDIIMFPSNVRHMVGKNITDKIRITYAYNLEITE